MNMKKWLFQALKIVVSSGLIVFLVMKLSPGELIPQVMAMEVLPLIAGIIIFLFSNILGALQWHLLLRGGEISLPLSRTVRLYFVGLFFNNFLPANVGGDAVKIYDVARDGNDPHHVFAVTLLDRVVGITALCMLALVSSLILLIRGGNENMWFYMAIAGTCIILVFTVIASRGMSNLIRGLVRNIGIWKIGERIENILNHLSRFRRMRPLLGRVILLALVVQFLRITTHMMVGSSLGINLSAWDLVHFYVFVPLLGLLMVLPISINGWGIREGAGILLFTQIGVSQELAFLMEFITAAVMITVSLGGGILFLWRHIGKRGVKIENGGAG